MFFLMVSALNSKFPHCEGLLQYEYEASLIMRDFEQFAFRQFVSVASLAQQYPVDPD
jgi:hypothetical protein